MTILDFPDDESVSSGDVSFTYGFPAPYRTDAAHGLPVSKSRVLLEQLATIIERVAPRRIIELGIYRGGSAALIATMARPEKMVALELSPRPVDALESFLERHELSGSVIPYYGVDQADAARIADILDAEFGAAAIDFVIDDASHLYEPSRASFQLIFPRLRPGGVYVIEDWASEHTLGAVIAEHIDQGGARAGAFVARLADSVARSDESLADELRNQPVRGTVARASRHVAVRDGMVPLSRLASELVLVAAESRDIVRRIEITQGWIEVERGEGEIDGDDWLDRAAMDLFGSLRSPTASGGHQTIGT